jgi:glutathione synthase/RimK-type ligase-like ATP-grasp enzyme
MERSRVGPIALATAADYASLPPDDAPLVRALDASGVDAEPAVWSDDSVDWTRYRGVVIRSCWDYHLRLPEFLAWVDALERGRVPVWNSPATLRWNTSKHYLRDLAERGVSVPPTAWLPQGDDDASQSLLDTGWRDVVLKPAVSASAFETWRTTLPLDDADRARLARLHAHSDVLVQPFLAEVQRAGELSLMYLDGRFSHAVVKRPASRDFRVQAEHGGTAERVEASGAIVGWGDGVLRALDEMPLYARVDLVETGDGPLLMELELVEPSLFFGLAPEAATRLAAAVRARL